MGVSQKNTDLQKCIPIARGISVRDCRDTCCHTFDKVHSLHAGTYTFKEGKKNGGMGAGRGQVAGKGAKITVGFEG